MAITSKKESRKEQKGKGKAASLPAKSALKGKKAVVAAPEAEDEEWESDADEDDEEDDDDEEEDEDNGGVSEKGMRRLMALVNEEDLDELEKVQLGLDGEEDEEDEGDEDEEDEEELEGESGDEQDGEISGESDDEDEDEDEDMDESAAVNDSILIDEADPDAIALDDLGSDVSVDEDAVPVRKVTADNKPAMRLLTESLRVTNLPFAEHLIISSRDTVDVDPSDDLKRETAFYKIALDQVAAARKLCSKHDIPFTRPTDYYAEMVKSDDHMERIRTKLVEESQGIKKSEEARKQRDLKKFGKQIQHEKLKQREMEKKGFQDKIQGIKRKRKDGMDLGEDGDEFGIAVEDGPEDRPARGSGGARGGRGGAGKPKMPRQARDNKYSLGGGGRRSKQNTKESSNDFAGWSGDGKKGGRGGKSGGGAQRGRNRPGKARRQAGRK